MFENIFENEYPKKLIESMIKQNKLTHAILLVGETGLGKLTFAKEIAKTIAYNNTPSRSIENYIDINLLKSDDSSSIMIDQIRNIKNKLNITPNESEKKIQIIANCEKMTVAAQNSLLKSLEDPSKSTIFILTTSNINKLLKTITSRATIINLQKISESKANQVLSDKYPNIEKELIYRLIKIFGGNLGLISKILESNDLSVDLFETLLFYLLSNNEYQALKLISQFDSKPKLAPFLELFKIYFQNILKLTLINNHENLSLIFKNHDYKNFLSISKKLFVSDLLTQTLDYISSNVNLNLILSYLNFNLFH